MSLTPEQHYQIINDIGALKEGHRNLEKADEKHETRSQRLESKIDGIAAQVKSELDKARTETEKMINDAVARAAMNAAELVLARQRDDASKTPPKPNPVTKGATWAANNPAPASVIGLLTALLLFLAGRADLVPAFLSHP